MELRLRVLITGGYGFIGREIATRLRAAGHDIVVLVRSRRTAARLVPGTPSIEADLRDTAVESEWRRRLSGIDAVVNAAGVLQRGSLDDPVAVHHESVAALVEACVASDVPRFVQISAVGAHEMAEVEFLRTKAHGDAAVRASSLDWTIVRPGLVLGPDAFGGSALLRALSVFPLVQPLPLADTPIQSVSIRDLADVVLDAVEGRLPARVEFDLVEETPHDFGSLIRAFRVWLGAKPARWHVDVPDFAMAVAASVADALGALGWRSPLRSTALRVLKNGIIGDPAPFRAVSTRRLSSLPETLALCPATLQDRWFARFYLAMPVVIAVLASFWIVTGVLALRDVQAAAVLSGLGGSAASTAVVGGAVIDIGLGLAILYRPWARYACCGMIVVTLGYLLAGSIIRPDLWIDPLGPLLKAIPAAALAAVAAVGLVER